MFLTVVGLFIGCSVIVYSTIKSSGPDRSKDRALLQKIILTNIQFNSIVASFDLKWPEPLKSLLSSFSQVSVTQATSSLDCLMLDAGVTKSNYFVRTLGWAILPWACIVLPVFIFIPMRNRNIKRIRQKGGYEGEIIKAIDDVKSYYSTTLLVLLYTIHPYLVETLSMMLLCQELGAPGDSLQFLVPDMSHECWGTAHRYWLLGTGLPLAIYAIAIPLGTFVYLYKKRAIIQHENRR